MDNRAIFIRFASVLFLLSGSLFSCANPPKESCESSICLSSSVQSLYVSYVKNCPDTGKMPLGYASWLSSSKGEKEAVESSFLFGEVPPSEEQGRNGDSYLDFKSYDLFVKDLSAWQKIENIKDREGYVWAKASIQSKERLSENWHLNDDDCSLSLSLSPLTHFVSAISSGMLKITSSDETVVTVHDFCVHAVKEGKATIEVSYLDAKDSVEVTVLPSELPEGEDRYADAEKIVIWAGKEEHSTLIELINRYNRENLKHINAALRSVDTYAIAQKLLEEPSTGAYPSLFLCPDGDLPLLTKKHAIEALPQEKENAIRRQDSDPAIDSVVYDGAAVAFPLTIGGCPFLYYDSKAVTDEQASTWEGLTELASEGHQVIFDITNGWYVNSIFQAEGVTGKDSIRFKENDNGEIVYDILWDSEKAVEAASYFSRLVRPKYQSKAMATPPSGPGVEVLFADGTAIAAVSGAWSYQDIRYCCPSIKARRLPSFTDRNGEHPMTAFANGRVYAVNAHASEAEKEAAFSLGEYLTSKEAQLLRYANQGMLPCNLESLEDASFLESLDIGTKALMEQSQHAIIQAKAVESRYWDVGASIGRAMIKGDPGESGWAEFLKQQCDLLRAPAKK